MLLMKKTISFGLVICAALFLTACSFRIPFIVENLSRSNITVKYEAKNPDWDNLTPYIVDLNSLNKNDSKQWREAAPEDYKLDKEKGIVEVNLQPNYALKLASEDPYFIEKEPYGNYFNIKNLSIDGKNGSIKIEGNQVFEIFQPEPANWFTLGPKNSSYVFRYKESKSVIQ